MRVHLTAALLSMACGQSITPINGPDGSHPPPVDGGTPIGQVDGDIVTPLDHLPPLTNVRAVLRDDSVGIDFDPVAGALDYRVYPLPADADVMTNADGTVTVHNAIYRCAGNRMTHDQLNTVNQSDPNLSIQSSYGPTIDIDADPAQHIVGHVYVEDGPDRAAVYAVAGFPWSGDSIDASWRESRLKIYTTSASERQSYLDMGWRDDGVVFYVPTAAGATTQTLYTSQHSEIVAGQGWTHRERYYFGVARMADHAGDEIAPSAVFEVLGAPATGTQPLYATLLGAEQQHTELSVGIERFRRAAFQGNSPLWHLEWSGLTAETTLVIEALDQGCPFQGMLAGEHLDAPPHQTFYTLDELRAASSTTEVFVNGQHAATNRPRAIARSYVIAAPAPHDPTAWDFYDDFQGGLGTITPIAGCTAYNCLRWQTANYQIDAYQLDEPSGVPVVAFGSVLGQFWETFDDFGQDVTGKMRFTARQSAMVSSDAASFLHVTMSVDIVSTDRRYPQLMISDQMAPVQEGLANAENDTILVQSILGPSMRVEVQAIHGLVNGGPWDVNNQASEHRIIDYEEYSGGDLDPAPADSPLEHAGVDRMTRFDVYLSSQRIYVLMDGQPAGCTLLPSQMQMTGPVSVTLGDVLYHEGAPDEQVCSQERPFTFLHAHQCTETRRHFDDFGFRSGVPAPPWNEAMFPCGAY